MWIIFSRGKQSNATAILMTENVANITDRLAINAAETASNKSGHNNAPEKDKDESTTEKTLLELKKLNKIQHPH